MNRTEALAAVVAIDPTAALQVAEDPSYDEEIVLFGNENIAVQISVIRGGLLFCASVASGEGDDFGVRHGAETLDPAAAARQAVEYARLDGLLIADPAEMAALARFDRSL